MITKSDVMVVESPALLLEHSPDGLPCSSPIADQQHDEGEQAEDIAALFACQAARLGLRTSAAIRFTHAPASQYMMNTLKDQGIDLSASQIDSQSSDTETDLSSPLTPGSDQSDLHRSRLKQILSRTNHLHLPVSDLQPDDHHAVASLIKHARENYLTVSLSLHWNGRESLEWLWDVLPGISVFLPTEKEALHLSGSSDAHASIAHLAARIPIAAVKLQDGGALLRSGAKTLHQDLLQSKTPDAQTSSDPTAADESFDAGLVYGYLKGWPLHRTLELAAACRSLAGSKSSMSELPDMEAALQFIQDQL